MSASPIVRRLACALTLASALVGCEGPDAAASVAAATPVPSATCVEAFESAARAAREAGRAAPDQEAFEAACAELPESAQHCLGMEHALAHAAECAAAHRALSPEQRSRLREVARR